MLFSAGGEVLAGSGPLPLRHTHTQINHNIEVICVNLRLSNSSVFRGLGQKRKLQVGERQMGEIGANTATVIESFLQAELRTDGLNGVMCHIIK